MSEMHERDLIHEARLAVLVAEVTRELPDLRRALALIQEAVVRSTSADARRTVSELAGMTADIAEEIAVECAQRVLASRRRS